MRLLKVSLLAVAMICVAGCFSAPDQEMIAKQRQEKPWVVTKTEEVTVYGVLDHNTNSVIFFTNKGGVSHIH